MMSGDVGMPSADTDADGNVTSAVMMRFSLRVLLFIQFAVALVACLVWWGLQRGPPEWCEIKPFLGKYRVGKLILGKTPLCSKLWFIGSSQITTR